LRDGDSDSKREGETVEAVGGNEVGVDAVTGSREVGVEAEEGKEVWLELLRGNNVGV
jgi:hypothetical protein